MNCEKLSHELVPLYSKVRTVYRFLSRLARIHSGWMHGDLRRHMSRLLHHAGAAADAPSSALRTQSLRYAKLSAVKLCAALDAANIDELLPDNAYDLARVHLAAVLAELGVMLPVEKLEAEPPTDAGSPPRTPSGRSDDVPPTATMAAATATDNRLEPKQNDALATIPTIGTG